MTVKWNPRYVAYAKSQGRSPKDQQNHDRAHHNQHGFMLWLSPRLREFERSIGQADLSQPLSEETSDRFDTWLESNLEPAEGEASD